MRIREMEIFMMRMLCLKDSKRRQDVRMWVFCHLFAEIQKRPKLEKWKLSSRFQFMSHRRLSCHNSASQDVNRKMRHIHIIILLSTSFSFFFSFCPKKHLRPFYSWQWFWHWNIKEKQFFLCATLKQHTLTYAQTYNIHARRLLFIERFTNIGKNMK